MKKKRTKEWKDEQDEGQAFDEALRQILGAPEPKKKRAKKKRAKRK